MDDNNSFSQAYHNETLILVPINNDAIDPVTKHIRSQYNPPMQYAMFVADSSGRIRRADILLFYPKTSGTTLPEKFFTTFFEQQKLSLDGTVALIGLKDIPIIEITFEGGYLSTSKEWQARLIQASQSERICIDWYWVEVWYYPSTGQTTTTEIYLGQTCSPVGGGSGGGGSTPQQNTGIASSTEVYVNSGRNNYTSPPQVYTLTAKYTLTCQQFPNPNLNVFTQAINSGIESDPDYSIHIPTSTYQISFGMGTQSVSLINNNKTCRAGFSVPVSYPNIPLTYTPHPNHLSGQVNYFYADLIL